jgi:alpha-L-rhamnosidase
MESHSLKIILSSFLTITMSLFICFNVNAQGITRMRCEYMVRPMCIDNTSPRFTWNYSLKSFKDQAKYQIKVYEDKSSSKVASARDLLWNSGVVTGSVPLAIYKGKRLSSFKRYYWQVTVWDAKGRKITSDVDWFETALINHEDWAAKWITDPHDCNFEPSPMLRKTFLLDGKQLKRAKIYYSAAAYGAIKINGKSISNALLNPGFTAYDKRNLYSVSDVTSLVCQGENVISAVLGNGFYNEIGKVATWSFEKARWRNRPCMTCLLRLEFTDGSCCQIISDDSWKTTTGPYLMNNIYSGDTYDSRLEKDGWETAGYDDSSWGKAYITKGPSPLLVAQTAPEIQVTEEFSATDFTSQGDTLFVYSFPQNISGFCKLNIKGESGTKITLRHGEIKESDGRLQTGNIDVYFNPLPGKSFQTDTYYLNGKKQVLMPQFCYHGFKYVEVKASRPVTLAKEDLKAEFFHTDVEPVGNFECSDDLFNKLNKAVKYTYLSNLQSIPTDCPQREKNGWTNDAHMAIDLALLNYDGIRLYEKWINDYLDNQNDSGRIAGIIPTDSWGYADWIGPVWDAAMFGIPMKLYYYYGDKSSIERIWPVCVKYLNYLKGRENKDKTVTYGIGDWVFYKTPTPTDFTSTCYYYFDNVTMARFADLLGKDGKQYKEKAEYLLNYINKKYFDKDKALYSAGTQSAQGVPLYLGIVPKAFEQKVADNLSRMIKANGNALDCGVLGSKSILRMLVKYGYADQAFEIANRTDAPSWGNWIKLGRTTIPETWSLSARFRDASLNHVFLGDINAWMYNDLAGINYDSAHPGFKHFFIKPHFVKGLDWVKAKYYSVQGLIRVEWSTSDGKVLMTVEVPSNTTATMDIKGKHINLISGIHKLTF